jgi:hypothetical protein
MKLAGLLLLLFAFSAAPPLHAAACVPALLSVYDTPSFSCAMGGSLVVTDFTFNLLAHSVVVADTEITVTPVFGVDRYGLQFSSPKFNVTGTDFVNLEINYTWDPTDLRSLEDALDTSTPVAPGFVKVTTTGCEGFAFSGSLCAGTTTTLMVSHDGITPILFDSSLPFPSGTQTLGIRNAVDFDANTASSEFTSFTNTVVVPEPSTVTAGLFLLSLLLRRCRVRPR